MALEHRREDALTVTQLNTLVHDVLASNDIFSAIAVKFTVPITYNGFTFFVEFKCFIHDFKLPG